MTTPANDGRSDVASQNDLVELYGPAFSKTDCDRVGKLNERFFAAYYHQTGHVLYESNERRFYTYSKGTGLWQHAPEECIQETLSQQILRFGRALQIDVSSKISTTSIRGVVGALKGIASQAGAFDRKKDFVHVGNGAIHFQSETVVLSACRPEYYSRNRCPIDFIADAECPRFLNELLGPVLSRDDIGLLQEFVGLCLGGNNLAQRILILEGPGGSGKSTMAEIVKQLIGAANWTQLRTEHLGSRFETCRYCGKTLLIGSDVPANFLNHPTAFHLKSIVGGDPLAAEAKGSNTTFEIQGNFNVIVTSNVRLCVRLQGDGDAWRRRLAIVRFSARPPGIKTVPEFAAKLVAEEGPGILRWGLAGYLRALHRIEATGEMSLSADQLERVDSLLLESDSAREFVREIVQLADGDLSSAELSEEYVRYCHDRGWKPFSEAAAAKSLSEAMLELLRKSACHNLQREGSPVRGWRGVAFRLRVIKENIPDTEAYAGN